MLGCFPYVALSFCFMNLYYSFVGLNISLCLCLSNKPKTLNSVLQWGHDDWKYIPTVYAIVKQLPISMILYKTWIDYRSKYENKA